jgi:hypothetical protein
VCVCVGKKEEKKKQTSIHERRTNDDHFCLFLARARALPFILPLPVSFFFRFSRSRYYFVFVGCCWLVFRLKLFLTSNHGG